MSIFEGVKIESITEFNGVKPLLDTVDVTPGDALVATNCVFAPGKAQTRTGFSLSGAVTTDDRAISPHYYAYGNSATARADYLAFVDKPQGNTPGYTIKARDLAAGTSYDVLTVGIGASAPGSASFVAEGKRLYASLATATGVPWGTGRGLVWDGDTSHTMDECFQRPMKTTEVTLGLTQPGAGVCTAGTHYVGVLFQTRSGYWTRPGPVDSALVLQPQSIASTGTNNIRATLTPATTWPTWIAAVQLIYTSTLNSFQYYLVPGTITSITAGSATVYTIDFSVADIQIRAVGSQGAGTLADDYFSLISMDASNTPPFPVKFQVAWGNRIAWVCNYGGVDSIFASDPLNPEWISADQHILQLPSGLPIGAVWVLRGILYAVSSAGGVFAFTDNGGRPITFAPPQTIDARISCPFNSRVTVASTGGYAFVYADQGLFLYSGTTFPLLPMNYYQQPDMTESVAINSFNTIAIKDFAQEQILMVQRVDSIYTFNYQMGSTPEKVRASKWTSNLFPTGISPAIEAVRNPTTNAWEVWVARGRSGLDAFTSQGGVFRHKSVQANDPALYTDYLDSTTGVYGIDWQYQNGVLPDKSNGEIWNHLALRVRAKTTQATVSVSGITKAAAAVVTTSVVHGMAVGTTLTATISGATGTGWTTINATFTPTILTQTTFSVPLNSTGFGTLGGTVIVTINGALAVTVKSLDDVDSVTPVLSPMAISANPGKRYDLPYDMQSENASYLITNGALAGNGVALSEIKHAFNLFAVEH